MGETPSSRDNREAVRPRQPRLPARPVKRRRKASLVSSLLVLVTALLLCAAIFCGYLLAKTPVLRALLHHPTVANQFPGVAAMNVMIVGRDYDYNNQDQVIKTHARSDMLMIGRLDFTNGTVRLLSIPRDTHARIPGHGTHKINTAHAIGGPALAAQTITRNFGIPVDHYIALDFQGFEKAIDLMQGVDLSVDRKMDYDDNWGHLHIHLLPGEQHLNGEQAMGFVRFRHADSDLVRTKRQQALVAAIKRKMIAPSTLVELPAIINTINKHIDSDLTTDQKIALAQFIRSAPRQNVQMVTLPSTEGSYYVYTDWAQASPLIQTWFGVTPPPSFDRPHRRRLLASRLSGYRRQTAAML